MAPLGIVEYLGKSRTIRCDRQAVRAVAATGQNLSFCYEAGPCGYGILRQIKGLASCDVVAHR